jgi:hypothetical protein
VVKAVLGLILEYIMGDKTLEAQWDELPDFLTDMILDGLGVINHDEETHCHSNDTCEINRAS